MPQNRNTGALFIRDGALSFLALLLAFAAFDDITTDNATSFKVEYALLVACAVWYGVVGVRLLRLRYRTLGVASLAALAGALWGQRAIGPGMTPGFRPEYVVVTGAFLWFLALAISLVVLGSRASRSTTARDRH
jgi:hypothetical protein